MKTLKLLLKKFRALKISLSHKFMIGVTITLIIAMGGSIYMINANHERLVMEQVDMQAKALFRQIVITRKWVADHGGVFVEELPWNEVSPYLKDPEIVDRQGKKYLKESPAMVTKELSRYAKEEGLYWFNITSLKLVNPENAPDSFEAEALKKFEAGKATEYYRTEKIEGSYYYRYTAPLYIEESCLKCHSSQGYKTGDVRGAISVTVPMDNAMKMITAEKRNMMAASAVSVSLLVLILYIMMKELVLRPVQDLKLSIKNFSRGSKEERMIMKTGDELEDLSRSFVEMSDSITEYHTGLEEKVKSATNGLENANARLTDLNEKKSDFIAKISHELRTPMTSIKGAMDYISTKFSKMNSREDEIADLVEFLDVIRNNADRLIRLVNDTLNLERIESGALDLHMTGIDIVALVKDVLISFQSVTSERKIIFNINSPNNVRLDADEDMIRQVLINLISNAINYSPDNSGIRIKISAAGDSVEMVISDEGPGIPVEDHEKIFDKFYTISKRQGTGLGLAICKGIVDAHHGQISVIKDVEKGSSIKIVLPKNRKEVQ